MVVEFDRVHSSKKQKFLEEMMIQVNEQIHNLDTGLIKKMSKCPICYEPKLVFYINKYGFDMDKCTNCGLVCCNPYPTNEQISYYYNSEMKKFENDFFMDSFHHRVNIFFPRIEIIKTFCDRGTLLDVGSSIGIFVEALNQSTHAFDVTCCDLSEDACERLASLYPDVKIINSDYRQIRKKETYDVITMWDTVEHIVDQDDLFKSVNALLNEDGYFFFSTPNTKSLEWIIADTSHVQLLPPGHVNLLNMSSISILLERHGFALKNSFTLNPSLDIDYILKLGKSNVNTNTRTGTFLTTMLENDAFRPGFEELLREQKMGGNIVIAAQKRIGWD